MSNNTNAIILSISASYKSKGDTRAANNTVVINCDSEHEALTLERALVECFDSSRARKREAVLNAADRLGIKVEARDNYELRALEKAAQIQAKLLVSLSERYCWLTKEEAPFPVKMSCRVQTVDSMIAPRD